MNPEHLQQFELDGSVLVRLCSCSAEVLDRDVIGKSLAQLTHEHSIHIQDSNSEAKASDNP